VKLKITIDSRTYEVVVEAAEPEPPPTPRGYRTVSAPLRVPAATPPPPSAPVTANEEKLCRSPVSGIVVRVPAQPGQNIQNGDVLLVLEAMKMETNITAPTAGKIKDIAVAAGDSVQAGQVLVELG
jgi:methylmalonyl-CoA carboxyltransferase 1.3S subunit